MYCLCMKLKILEYLFDQLKNCLTLKLLIKLAQFESAFSYHFFFFLIFRNESAAGNTIQQNNKKKPYVLLVYEIENIRIFV